MQNALVLVDIQNDFIPGGALGVPNGDKIIPLVNRLQSCFDLVVATQDWHPVDHVSFVENHAGRTAGDKVLLDGTPQILWPAHCVQGTYGAEFAPGLDCSRVARVFQKGVDPKIDSYSGFFDNNHQRSTGLGEYLREKGVDHVHLCGLATDFCVKYSALDAVQLGFHTTVIEDACRGITPHHKTTHGPDVCDALEEMRNAGVKVISSTMILEPDAIICDDGVVCE